MQGSGLTPLDGTPKSNEEVHVFGKNLEERVVTNDDEDGKSPSISFSTSQNYRNDCEEEMEKLRQRKFDPKTGEEDERTIFQGEFKLFVWDLKTSNWIERGRGQLKLNDSVNDTDKSRLIMRVSGTHKIVLNVAVNHSFFRIIASSKMNIRFTDGQTVWAASGSNAHHLKELLEPRLKIPSRPGCELEKKRAKPEIEEDEAPCKKTKADLEEIVRSEPKNQEQNESVERQAEKSEEPKDTPGEAAKEADETPEGAEEVPEKPTILDGEPAEPTKERIIKSGEPEEESSKESEKESDKGLQEKNLDNAVNPDTHHVEADVSEKEPSTEAKSK